MFAVNSSLHPRNGREWTVACLDPTKRTLWNRRKEALKKQESLERRMKKKNERIVNKSNPSVDELKPPALLEYPISQLAQSSRGSVTRFPFRQSSFFFLFGLRFFLSFFLLLILFSRPFPSSLLHLLVASISARAASLSPAARIRFASSSLLSRFCCTMTLVPSRLP